MAGKECAFTSMRMGTAFCAQYGRQQRWHSGHVLVRILVQRLLAVCHAQQHFPWTQMAAAAAALEYPSCKKLMQGYSYRSN
mmetsp:Transcript_13317/g.19041  ORF Transcript_13317/g.19041 Transcript_13317/m.19041 type:complete len:81 (-) Transcript_13317:139-381(-)